MKTKSQKTRSNGSESKFDRHDTLQHLFEEHLLDICDAEQQLIDALPEMVEAAENEELKNLINDHLEESKQQLERIEKISNRLGIEKGGFRCEAIRVMVEDAKEIMQEFEKGPVRDAAIIIAAQKIEHYEIAVYGSLCELADVLGLDKTCILLDKTLEEEKEADRLLSDIAQDVNDEANMLGETRERVY